MSFPTLGQRLVGRKTVVYPQPLGPNGHCSAPTLSPAAWRSGRHRDGGPRRRTCRTRGRRDTPRSSASQPAHRRGGMSLPAKPEAQSGLLPPWGRPGAHSQVGPPGGGLRGPIPSVHWPWPCPQAVPQPPVPVTETVVRQSLTVTAWMSTALPSVAVSRSDGIGRGPHALARRELTRPEPSWGAC